MAKPGKRPKRTEVTNRPQAPQPKLLPGAQGWSFSFRFWNQIDDFGLSKTEPKWFASLLERLKDLSGSTVDGFVSDGARRKAMRYHPIDWHNRGIPISRSDLTWLPADYRDNDEEYPLFQFMISQSLGRVVGFWDEHQVFNIVLLDPMHNIQPTQDTGYRVDKCYPLSCHYTALMEDVGRAKALSCTGANCPRSLQIEGIPSDSHPENAVLVMIDDSMCEYANELITSGKASSFKEMLEFGILSIDSGPTGQNQTSTDPPSA